LPGHLRLLALDVVLELGEVVVPALLQVVPPVGDLSAAGVGRVAELLGLLLSNRPRVLDVLLYVGLCLVLRGRSALFRFLGARSASFLSSSDRAMSAS
jgi:hypothetical protein